MSVPSDEDVRWMRRALREARKGRPSPNPHVGAVLVKAGRLLAVGHHARAGRAHAEVVALRRAGEAARGATLYVTFEPCNHWGRTGPCTEAIERAGVARVVVGCRDPAPHVPGAVERLRRRGIEVDVGILQQEARRLVDDFVRHFTQGMPHVVLKAAVTLDGRIAARGGASRWITGEMARRRAHALRARADAVLVGVGTVIADDPRLTVRRVRGTSPVRIVLDTHLRVPLDAALVRTARQVPTWIVHGPEPDAERCSMLHEAGVELIEVPLGSDGRLDPVAALRAVAERDVVRLLVEGGARVHGTLLREGLVQEAALFVAPVLFGDPEALPVAFGPPLLDPAQGWRIEPLRIQRLGRDVLFEGPLRGGSSGQESPPDRGGGEV